MVDYKDLGQRIRKARKAVRLTQEQLAAKTGLSASFMGHIERGSRVASLESLINICNTLNISPNQLLAASLTNTSAIEIEPLSSENRVRLSEFLALAQQTVQNWNKQ